MERIIKGDIVVIPFPFSDLSLIKRRPAMVLTVLDGDDLILLQITSKNIFDNYSIPLNHNDFTSGELHQSSNIRPNRIFTADKAIIIYKIGHLNDTKIDETVNAVMEIIRR